MSDTLHADTSFAPPTVRFLLAVVAASAGKLLMIWTVVVSRIFASWNQLDGWLRQLERLRRAA